MSIRSTQSLFVEFTMSTTTPDGTEVWPDAAGGAGVTVYYKDLALDTPLVDFTKAKVNYSSSIRGTGTRYNATAKVQSNNLIRFYYGSNSSTNRIDGVYTVVEYQ